MKPNADAEAKKMILPAPLEENVQREWTCAMCQVTTTSETTLNLHLQGRKHRAKCEELKAGKQTTKKGVTIGEPNRVRFCAICQVKTQSEASWNTHLQSQKHKSKCMEFNARVVAAYRSEFLSTTTKSNLSKQDPNIAPSRGGPIEFRSANQDLKVKSSGGGPNNRFGCDICQVKIRNEASLKSHLEGKKHKSKCEQLKSEETTESDRGESFGGITTSSAPSANNSGGQNNSGGRNNNKRIKNFNYLSGQQQQQTATLAYSAFAPPGWSSLARYYLQHPPLDVPPCLYPTAAPKSSCNSGLLGPAPCVPASTTQAFLNADPHQVEGND